MRGLLILGVIGAGAYIANKRGLLPQIGPIVAAGEEIFERASHILPQEEWDTPRQERLVKADAIKEASGGYVVPILGKDETVEMNPYEGMLRGNWQHVSGWARSNVGWAAAIARVENARMNPDAEGDGGRSLGVYQVQIPTAETCYRAGYTRFQPTRETLKTIDGGVYFGTAEMERLSRMGRGLDWTIKAYNGGAGFEDMPASYIKERDGYLVKVKQAFVALYGSGGAV